jgi:hypothetical protein
MPRHRRGPADGVAAFPSGGRMSEPFELDDRISADCVNRVLDSLNRGVRFSIGISLIVAATLFSQDVSELDISHFVVFNSYKINSQYVPTLLWITLSYIELGEYYKLRILDRLLEENLTRRKTITRIINYHVLWQNYLATGKIILPQVSLWYPVSAHWWVSKNYLHGYTDCVLYFWYIRFRNLHL